MPVIEPPPQPDDNREPLNESALQSSSPNDCHLAADSSNIKDVYPEKNQFTNRHVMVQTSQSSASMQNSLPTTRCGEHSDHILTSNQSANSPSIYEQHTSEPLKGISNPIKMISDDIRREQVVSGKEDIASNVEQNNIKDLISSLDQTSYRLGYGSLPTSSNQTGSIAPNSFPEYPVHQRIVSEAAPSVQNHPQYATKTPNPSETRQVSNPFESQGLDGREEDLYQFPNLDVHGRRVIPQGIYHSLDRSSANGRGPMAGNMRANLAHPSMQYRVPEPAAPDYSTQRLGMYPNFPRITIPPHSTAPVYSRDRTYRERQMYPGKVRVHSGQSEAYLHSENDAFGSQFGQVRGIDGHAAHYNQGDRNRSSLQQTRQNQRNRGSSLHKSTSQVHRELPFPENCKLFVAGLPNNFTAKDVWNMLEPVEGLDWISEPRIGLNKGASTYVKVA